MVFFSNLSEFGPRSGLDERVLVKLRERRCWMLCDAGARSWDSGRRADVVGVSRDASLVVPRLVIGGGGRARTPSRQPVSRVHAIEQTQLRKHVASIGGTPES